jgi:nitrate reductase gamma subunit
MVDYPKPWLLFWIAASLALGYMSYAFIRKWRSWSRGTAASPVPGGRRGRAVKLWAAEVFLQRQLFALSHVRWLIHMLIFYGFGGLLSLSAFFFVLRPLGPLGIDLGLAHFFIQGKGHLIVKLWGDAFGLALLAGLLGALGRRLFFRAAGQDNSQADMGLVLFLLWLTVSGFALEAVRISLVPESQARYPFFAHFIIPSGLLTIDQALPWLTGLWSLHVFSVVGLMLYLPHSKLLHSLLAPVVIAMNALEEQHRKDIYWPDIKKYRPTGSRKA